MCVLKPWEQFLAEVISILVNKQRRKVICRNNLVNQEVYKTLYLRPLGLTHALAEGDSFLYVLGALLRQNLSDQLLWILILVHNL